MSNVELNNIRVHYAVDATVNLGNFENVKPHFAMSADVPEGTSPVDAFNKIKSLCDSLLQREVAETKAEARG